MVRAGYFSGSLLLSPEKEPRLFTQDAPTQRAMLTLALTIGVDP
jgi:hypothetical protein